MQRLQPARRYKFGVQTSVRNEANGWMTQPNLLACQGSACYQGLVCRYFRHGFTRKIGRMAKLTLGANPFLLGFDQYDRLLERTEKATGDGYPPYNVEQVSSNCIRISVAVAGFGEDDLNITVEDKQLVVAGRQKPEEGERVFLHRGIATRQFQRRFVLAEGLEVQGATLDNGLLHIDLERRVEERKVRRVAISRS